MTARRTAEILGGNETVRRLMSESLRGLGVDVVESDGESAASEVLMDLLVADVDSGIAVTERAAAYVDDDRLVVLCGLRDSREQHGDRRWVDRPFTPTAFMTECADALGVVIGEPPAGEFDVNATAALKPPPSVARNSSEPITRELAYDEAQELERRLGLDPGVLAANADVTVSDGDAFEMLELDDSAILAVDHLKFALGGKLRGMVEKRRVANDEIVAQREDDVQFRVTRSPTFNQTMPDTPHALGDADFDSVDDTRDRQATSNVGSAPGRSSSESGIEDLPPAGAGADLQLQIRGVARMLAESWQRIALTSRTEDRADRIERVLTAAVGKGLRGAAEEVQRIPAASGFAGALASLTFVELIRTARDRRLRGRIEVAIGAEAFVVHIDGLYLEEIDTLSGNVDGMLLDILRQGGALDERTYNELSDAVEAGRMVGPLELELARKKVVADATLQSARVVRAREIFRRLCTSRGGQFAFLEIRPGDGQPWPIDPLRVNVDQLMLELLRESSIDTGDSQATASTRLQLDPNRAAALEPNRLTDEERNVMMFFRDGDTLEGARERLQKQAGPEDVDRIVDRLKKVELLRRSNPSIAVPARVEQLSREPREPAPVPPTAVGPVDAARLAASTDTDQTASLNANWDLIPDTRELDELIDEGIAAYETSASEAVVDDEDEQSS